MVRNIRTDNCKGQLEKPACHVKNSYISPVFAWLDEDGIHLSCGFIRYDVWKKGSCCICSFAVSIAKPEWLSLFAERQYLSRSTRCFLAQRPLICSDWMQIGTAYEIRPFLSLSTKHGLIRVSS